VAIVRSSNPAFLTLAKSEPSVALASLDLEVELPEAGTGDQAVSELTATETLVGGDPFSIFQWPHVAIGATQAHARGITGEGVRVAVVDSGIDCLHEDLRDRILPERASFVPLADGSGFEDPCEATNPHGTFMAGIIAATCDNGKGVCGVAPGAGLISVQVAPASGERFPWSQGAKGLDWASGVGRADIINASWVARLHKSVPEEWEEISDFLGNANRLMALVYRRGAVVFAGAGNDRPPLNVAFLTDLKLWPADNAPRVVTVGNVAPCGAALDGNVFNDFYDNPATDSNYGFDATENRFVVAPGGETQCNRGVQCQVAFLRFNCQGFDQSVTTAPTGTGPLNGYSAGAGTSSATASASGAAALILSRYPDMKVGELVDTVLGTAVDLGAPGYDPIFGYGRVSVSWLE
jgi:subtilisin family serine protease